MPDPKLPLDGIRVADLTVTWSGPFATMMLGDLGAEVIRIESQQHVPSTTRGIMPNPPKALAPNLGPLGRGYPDRDPGPRPWNRSALFNVHGRNKQSFTVNLRLPRGLELVKRLIALSDVFVENNAAGVVDKLGLDWATLRALNPRLIMVSMPALGLTGPYREYQGYGANVEAIAGFTAIRGYPEDAPASNASVFYMDSASGTTTAFAIIAALHHRERTGRGQFIEMAQAEAMLPHLGAQLLDVQMNQRDPQTLGNRHPWRAPQGVYPGAGDDQWLAISVGSDEEWAGLRRAMGDPEWARADEYADLLGRHQHHDALDAGIATWTRTLPPQEAAARCQAAGVPAGALLDEPNTYADPHLRAREFWLTLSHPEVGGPYEYPGHLWKYGATPLRHDRHAPALGEDNEYVYKQLLGLSDAEYAELEAEGHIGGMYFGV